MRRRIPKPCSADLPEEGPARQIGAMPSRADQPTAAAGDSAATTTLAAPTPTATATAAVIAAADPCVHCGFCLPTCASYRVLATEMDSPRGRIHMDPRLPGSDPPLSVATTSGCPAAGPRPWRSRWPEVRCVPGA